MPDHPELLDFEAQAELMRAEVAIEKAGDEGKHLEAALKRLDQALQACPEVLAAKVHRATAWYLKAERARRRGLPVPSAGAMMNRLGVSIPLSPLRSP